MIILKQGLPPDTRFVLEHSGTKEKVACKVVRPSREMPDGFQIPINSILPRPIFGGLHFRRTIGGRWTICSLQTGAGEKTAWSGSFQAKGSLRRSRLPPDRMIPIFFPAALSFRKSAGSGGHGARRLDDEFRAFPQQQHGLNDFFFGYQRNSVLLFRAELKM